MKSATDNPGNIDCFYKQHRQQLFTYALSITCCSEAAEDARQGLRLDRQPRGEDVLGDRELDPLGAAAAADLLQQVSHESLGGVLESQLLDLVQQQLLPPMERRHELEAEVDGLLQVAPEVLAVEREQIGVPDGPGVERMGSLGAKERSFGEGVSLLEDREDLLLAFERLPEERDLAVSDEEEPLRRIALGEEPLPGGHPDLEGPLDDRGQLFLGQVGEQIGVA